MVSRALLNTFALPVSIWALRNGLAYYRRLKQTYNAQRPSIQPLAPKLSTILNILFVVALICLGSTFPQFQPSNIFQETKSRFQAPTDVIFARLSSVRQLTSTDEVLKQKFVTKENRLVYLKYGPSVLASCVFCDEDIDYLIHALPSILGAHIAHLAVLGFTTSAALAGTTASRFRLPAIIAGGAIAIGELYLTYTHTGVLSILSTRATEIDFFHWRMRFLRGICFTAIDALLGLAIWLAGTNRFFIKPPGVSERLVGLCKMVEAANYRLWSTGHIRNAVLRDKECREKLEQYWNTEKELYEEREVVDAIRQVLDKMDTRQLNQQAEAEAEKLVTSLN